MSRFVIGASLAVLAVGWACGALAATGTYTIPSFGAPLGDGQFKMEVTIKYKGAKVTRTITVPKGAITPLAMVDCNGLSDADCLAKKLDAVNKASQDKAKVVADAINTAFATEFKARKVEVLTTTDITKTIIYVNGKRNVVDATLGGIIVPLVTANITKPVQVTEGKILGEAGNKGQFQGPPPKSPGGKGLFERATPGVQTVSTGTDPFGDPSYVQFGIDEIYVAEVDPTAGMSDQDVLMALAANLDSHGLPALFDSATETLSFEHPIPNGDTLVWGNTDSGLEFEMEQTDSIRAPEPGTWAMLLLGLGGLGAASRARRRGRRLAA
jgi:hypothetical protein